MNCKLEEIINAVPSLNYLSNQRMNGLKSWELTKLNKKANEKNKDFNIVKMKLLEQYGTKDEKREGYYAVRNTDEGYKDFEKEWDELRNKEIDIDYEKIELFRKDFEISPNDIELSKPFINWS